MVEHVMVSYLCHYYYYYFLEIDECIEGLSSCNMQCINTIGSYYCTCFTGFQLMNDNHTCNGESISCFTTACSIYFLTDINECTNNNGGCEDVCTNTIGSYTCSCQSIGYYLDNDKHNCSGDNYKHSLCVLK